jgi:YesN/AraC family two-component response regulator
MYKILVIDDEKPTLNMSRLLLGASGYSVVTAEGGEEGLEVFRREKPDIVITDMKMPGMDGLAILDEIKKESPATEVIVITGHGDSDLAEQAANHGSGGFIHKPIRKKILDEELKKAEDRLTKAKL